MALQWTKQRDGSWTAAAKRFRLVRISSDQWALEDMTRVALGLEGRQVGIYRTLPAGQVAAEAVDRSR